MKRSKIVNTAIASTVVMILASGFLSAQQASGQQEKQPSQKSEMKSMGNMSMEGMMKECSEHHQAVTKSLDQTSKTLEGAKQSNDPDKMRAAIDQAQKQLADMKDHMTMCGNMMNMMQKMQGGMMKGGSK
jgi:vancomycin resistance protein YoaR